MSEADLDDYVDPAPVPEPSDAITLAKEKASLPKPTIAEMIQTVTDIRYELEDFQLRCLVTQTNPEPHMPTMRRAAILAATANFLSLIQSKKAAVSQVLRGKP